MTYLGDHGKPPGRYAYQQRNGIDRRAADAEPLYPTRVGARCEVVGVSEERRYQLVIQFADGERGIARPEDVRK